MTLAQLGASVIRIDPLGGGNDYRRWPLAASGISLYWTALNKGKKSVAVDMASPAGRELVQALVAAPGPDCGLLLDNTVGQRWLSFDSMREKRSDVVHVRVQGHRDGRPAVDYTVNAAVGVPEMTGPESARDPINHVLPAWDLLTGSSAAVGLLAALRQRDVSGAGGQVEVALADVAVWGVATLGWLADAELSDEDRPRLGNHVYGSFGADFATADGRRVMVVALTEKQWRALCRVTGTSEVFKALEEAMDVDLDAESHRYALRETISAVLKPWFATRNLCQITAELDAARVLWGPYQTMRALARQQLGDANGIVSRIHQAGVGPVPVATNPLRWGGEWTPPEPAPLLGADTETVLVDVLGLTNAEIGRLDEQKVLSLRAETPS
jgi:2-methylfumaryl-CoA isomerase